MQQVDAPPAGSSAAVTSDAGLDVTHAAGEDVEASVTFSESVVVTRTPQSTLKVGNEDRAANY